MHEDAGDPPTQPSEGQAKPETQSPPSAAAEGASPSTDGDSGQTGGGGASDEARSDGGEDAAPRRRRRRRRRGRATPEAKDGEQPVGSAAGSEAPAGTSGSGGTSEEASAENQPSAPGNRSKKKASKKKASRKPKRERRGGKDGRHGSREHSDRGHSGRVHSDHGYSDHGHSGRGHSGRGSRTHAAAAIRELAAMTRDLLDAEDVPFLSRPRHLLLELRVPLDLERDGSKAAEQVVTQLLRRVQEVREHESALKPGSVYCYFNESAEAGTSRPSSVREVFDGYGSTGRPVFTDFVTMAVERRDEELQRMLDGEDLILTQVSMGHILRTEQLAAFGKQSPIYRVLGQVDAGLYTLTGSDQQAAFSFQLLRGRTLDGAPRFRLHWVSGADLRDVADPNLALVLSRFQQSLDQASLRFQGLESNGETPDEEEFVRPFLVDLAKRLKGRAKRGNRRTGHATERADSSQRPTSKAFEDAKNAGDDSVLRDDEQGTIVIAGPKNRIHVFSPEAKHVTSFVMNGHNLQMRKRDGRWLPSEPEDRGEFRIALRSRLESGDTEVSGDRPAD